MTTDAPQSFGSTTFTHVILIGAGVVGRAIALAHLQRNVPIVLADLDRNVLTDSLKWLLSLEQLQYGNLTLFPTGGHCIAIHRGPRPGTGIDELPSNAHGIILESVVEKLDVKRSLLNATSQHFGKNFAYASNTSSLRLRDIASACQFPENFCGMHFFMPVKDRDLVELVRLHDTNDATIDLMSELASRLGKDVLQVRDSPALVVNRILISYISQGLALLGQGASDQAIRDQARQFGLPRSPLEMVDMIGTRTAFDAGRAAWQAFPSRIEASPILPGLIKRKLAGWSSGSGFYDYDPNVDPPSPSKSLNDTALKIIEKYQRNVRVWTDNEVLLTLTIPMWIEAACILREGICQGLNSIELAMRRGLGLTSPSGFWRFFDSLENAQILDAIRQFSPSQKAMNAPEELVAALQATPSPTSAIWRFSAKE